MGNESEHTEISPSKLARVIACPASVGLTRKYLAECAADGEPASEKVCAARDEGTRKHEIIARCVMHNVQSHLHPFAIDHDQTGGDKDVETCLDALTKSFPRRGNFFRVEQKLIITPDISGTCDLYFVYDEDLYVVDYKFGQGQVEADDNPQLLAYAYGCIKDRRMVDMPHVDTITPVIVQPSGDPFVVKRGKFKTVEAVTRWALTTLAEAVALSKYPGVQPTAGDHCRWCRAKPVCSAWWGAGAAAMAMAEDFGGLTVERMADETLCALLDTVPDISSVLRAEATKRAKAFGRDGRVGNYTLRPGRVTKTWTDDAFDAVVGDALGEDLSLILKLDSVDYVLYCRPDLKDSGLYDVKTGEPYITKSRNTNTKGEEVNE